MRIIFLIIPLFATTAAMAQTGTPRLGVIKDVQRASANMPEGCANHMMALASETKWDRYYYIAWPDGSMAWVNINGRDVKLDRVKTTIRYIDDFGGFAVHEYKGGKTRIVISYQQATDYISVYPAKITISRGRYSRTYKLSGTPQCD